MFSAIRILARGCALMLAVSVPALAHEGHDHGSEPMAAPAQSLPRGAATSQSLQLVAVARGDTLAVYLDTLGGNEPVVDATIEAETPNGPAKAEVQTDGSYSLKAPWLVNILMKGQADLIFTVTAKGDVDVLPLTIKAAASQAAANAVTAEPLLHRLQHDLPVTFILLGAGLVAGLVFSGLFRRRRSIAALALVTATLVLLPTSSRAHDGDNHGQPAPAAVTASGDRAQRQADGAVFVPKPLQRIYGIRTTFAESGAFRRAVELPGRVMPDPNASGFVQSTVSGRLSPPPSGFPRLGSVVKAGDVVAYVTPPLQGIDISDMRQRQGELDQQIAIVERRLGRYQQLVAGGAVSKTQFEETQLELDGLRTRRASLDQVRREPEALLAPVSGVIAEGTPVAGQIAQSNAVIFQIVDPAKLWVEALSFGAVGGLENAAATAADGKALTLAFRGSGLADRSQSIPVHFSVESGADGVRVGQFVTVFVGSGEARTGIVVPRAAVVRGASGQEFVFEHVSPERFVQRMVRSEPLDGTRVLILAGLEAGKRVVAQGAELLDHVR